jgi:hypothetical protein
MKQSKPKFAESIVEDGFSYEKEGLSEGKFRQYFQGLPKQLLERLLKHFRARKEFEVCQLLRDMLRERAMGYS